MSNDLTFSVSRSSSRCPIASSVTLTRQQTRDGLYQRTGVSPECLEFALPGPPYRDLERP